MGRREQWRPVLDAEVRRWSALSPDELQAELPAVKAYSVEADGKHYQVEVEVLENTDRYVHVAVAVDDGVLPWAIHPLTESFLREK